MERRYFTSNVDCIRRACKATRVVLNHIGGFIDTLHGAGFDVELVVAKAVLPTSQSCQPLPFQCPSPYTADYGQTFPLAKSSSR